jgi:hypothetical protein
MSDVEGLNIEVVGEYLGTDTACGLNWFVHNHEADWFPNLLQIHRTTLFPKSTNSSNMATCVSGSTLH